jgi:hypothetical protein
MAQSDSERDPIEQLAESFLARFRARERPSLMQVTTAHPELADQIPALFQALTEMEQAGPVIGAATGLVAPQHRSSFREAPAVPSLGSSSTPRQNPADGAVH